jgi:hypothetical protein
VPEWALSWRYWLAGAAVFVAIYAVESLRKLGFIWPWPLVPLAVWAGLIVRKNRRTPSVGSNA